MVFLLAVLRIRFNILIVFECGKCSQPVDVSSCLLSPDFFQMSSDFKKPSSSSNSSRCLFQHVSHSKDRQNPAAPRFNKNEQLIPLQWLKGELHYSTVLFLFIDFIFAFIPHVLECQRIKICQNFHLFTIKKLYIT